MSLSIVSFSLGIFYGLFFLLSSVVTTLHLRVVISLLEIVKCYSEPRVVEKVGQEKNILSDAESDTN